MALTAVLALRQETRYALTLCRWIEMEAERRDSVLELWQDYQFVVKKLGFSEVRLTLEDGTNIWRADEPQGATSALQRTRHEINGGTILEFAGDTTTLPNKLFELLTELAAESWQKAGHRWQQIHKAPLQFMSVAAPDTRFFKRKLTRLYSPVSRGTLWTRIAGMAGRTA
jgi:hypothetical protein